MSEILVLLKKKNKFKIVPSGLSVWFVLIETKANGFFQMSMNQWISCWTYF